MNNGDIKFQRDAGVLLSELSSSLTSKTTTSKTETKKLYLNTNIFNEFLRRDIEEEYEISAKYPTFHKKFKNSLISAVELKEFFQFSLVFNNDDNFAQNLFEQNSLVQFYEKFYSNEKNAKDVLVLNSPKDQKNAVSVLVEFEYFLGASETNQENESFCSMATNFFQQIDHLTDVWNNIKSYAGMAVNIANAISKMTFDQVVKMVSSVVEKKFKEMQSRIQNYTLDAFNDIKKTHSRVLNKAKKMKEDATEFFSEKNLKNIVEQIKASINYVANLFEKLDLEEIEYMVYKFCQFSQKIEHILDSQISPLQMMLQTYQETNLAIKTTSNMNTAKAIGAGALRFDSQSYDTIYSNQTNMMRQESLKSGGNYVPPLSSGDIDGITPWNDSNGDSRIGFQGGWVGAVGREGWERVDNRARAGLMRVQQRLGKKLIVNSGYRPPWYNAKLAATTSGVAKNSLHMDGLALDITWGGFRSSSSAEKSAFVQVCREEGFTGFGGYGGFIHIDIGPKRSWGIIY